MAEKSGLPLVEQPDILHDPNSAFMAAYLEWAQHGRCNAAANRDDVTAVRKIINGGSNGLAECRAYLAKVKKVLADYHASPVATLVSDAVSPQGDGGADAELLFVQKRLKAMNCNPGIPTGILGRHAKAAGLCHDLCEEMAGRFCVVSPACWTAAGQPRIIAAIRSVFAPEPAIALSCAAVMAAMTYSHHQTTTSDGAQTTSGLFGVALI